MIKEEFWFTSQQDGLPIHVWRFSPDTPPVAAVQIAHGMVEHGARYERFAKALSDQGYIVYVNDHRGHGLTAGSPEKVGYLGDHDGFEMLVADMRQLTGIIKQEHPDIPVYLFGHSMGSFASQRYMEEYGNEVAGVILSGSNGNSPLFALGRIVAKQELRKHGPHALSPKLNQMSFGSYNKAFAPARTEYDWLSRDEAEVDKYIADPYCGAICTCEFYYDFMDGLVRNFKKETVRKVPKNLPVYIIAGSMDPVGSQGKGVRKLCEMYRKAGLRDVKMKLYDGARHEILNEINRDEVTGDILNWLAAQKAVKE